MAENNYLRKDRAKAKEMLGCLSSSQPLRNFLEISMMYDAGEYEGLHRKAEAVLSKDAAKNLSVP